LSCLVQRPAYVAGNILAQPKNLAKLPSAVEHQCAHSIRLPLCTGLRQRQKYLGQESSLVLPVSKHFTINYPDGSKGNISGPVKTDMLLAREIEESIDGTFNYIGHDGGVLVMHSMADLGKLKKARRGIDTNLLRRFYDGLFADHVVGFVFEERRASVEMLESPEAMALRLELL